MDPSQCLPPVRFFPLTAKSDPLLPAWEFMGEILDLQPHFEVSRDPAIKLDLSLIAIPTTPPHPPVRRVVRDPGELVLELRGVGHGFR